MNEEDGSRIDDQSFNKQAETKEPIIKSNEQTVKQLENTNFKDY